MNRHPALDDAAALHALLDRWVAAGWLRPIDRAVATFLDGRVPDGSPLATLAAVLASHQGGGGHVCLDLAAVLANPDFTLRMPPAEPTARQPLATDTPAVVFAGLALDVWRRALADHPAIATVRWDEEADDTGGRPLVLVDDDRPQLYLRRYWQVEGRVAAGLAGRDATDVPPPATVRRVLDALFPPASNDAPDWQKVACALAARQPFSIITGGPGTGKTTTVVRLLAALTSLHLDTDGSHALPRIALCAPTGKAAARLGESIGDKVRDIASISAEDDDGHWSRVAAHLPDEVHTIHRLIGTRPLAERPRHHRDHPLDLDIAVVDEASMVGVELMSQLVDALPSHCRLVMLGDKDQLASVEAGAVLGELCRETEHATYPGELQAYLEAASGVSLPAERSPSEDPILSRVATLRVSHRFGADSAIGGLAAAVNRGEAADVTRALGVPRAADGASGVDWLLDDPGHAADSPLARRVVEGLRPWLSIVAAQPSGFDPASVADEAVVADLFRRHNAFQLLCTLRRGESGVAGLNARAQAWLEHEGLLAVTEVSGPRPEWFPGRPVMVTRNDAQLGLANGDMGLTLPTRLPDGTVGLRVVFPRESGDGPRFRWISPSRLSEAETAFALTVHKSQGSEFTQVALVMPERRNPVLTRELLYTAITRARRRFTLVSPVRGDADPVRQATDVLTGAVTSVTRRSGNLRRRLVQRLNQRDGGSGVRTGEPLR